MKLAIFDDHRCGVIDGDEIVDVTAAVPYYDPDPFGAGWWIRLCRDFDSLRSTLEELAALGPRRTSPTCGSDPQR